MGPGVPLTQQTHTVKVVDAESSLLIVVMIPGA